MTRNRLTTASGVPSLKLRPTGPKTSAEPLFLKVARALDRTPVELAAALDLPVSSVAALTDPRAAGPLDDDVWWRIGEYVDVRLGALMAAKQQLDIQMTVARTSRVVRHAATRARGKRRGPGV